MQQNKQLKNDFFNISPFKNKMMKKLFPIPNFPIKCTSTLSLVKRIHFFSNASDDATLAFNDSN